MRTLDEKIASAERTVKRLEARVKALDGLGKEERFGPMGGRSATQMAENTESWINASKQLAKAKEWLSYLKARKEGLATGKIHPNGRPVKDTRVKEAFAAQAAATRLYFTTRVTIGSPVWDNVNERRVVYLKANKKTATVVDAQGVKETIPFEELIDLNPDGKPYTRKEWRELLSLYSGLK